MSRNSHPIVTGAEVPGGDYTAEWDLGKSFNSPPGQLPDVMMKPVVKLVANNEVGTLVGGVASE